MKILISILFAISVFLLGFWLFPSLHNSTSTRDDSYIFNMEYNRAKRIMTHSDSTKFIVEHQNGKVLSQQWNIVEINRNHTLQPKKWDIELMGSYIASFDDSDMGSPNLYFKTHVFLNGDCIRSETSLAQPSGCLKEHTTILIIEKVGDHVRIHSSVTICYERWLPGPFGNYADERVKRRVEKSVIELHKAVVELLGSGS